jgi:phage head maturation protease
MNKKDISQKAFVAIPKKVQLDAATCKALCKEAGLEYLEGYETRVFEYLVTDETPDRVGDVVKASGVDLKNYKKNAVIMVYHNYQSLPVGKAIKVWYDAASESIKAFALFLDKRVDDSGFSDTIYKYVQAGALRGASIGFKTIERYSPNNPEERKQLKLGKYGVLVSKSEMLEFSVCPVGMNPSAGVKAIDGAEITEEDLVVLKSLDIQEDNIDTVIIQRALDTQEKYLLEITEQLKEANLQIVDLQNKIKAITDIAIYKEDEENQTDLSAEDFKEILNNTFKGII